jgi:hypothetical protein
VSQLKIDPEAVRTIMQNSGQMLKHLNSITHQLSASRSNLDYRIQSRRNLGQRLQSAYSRTLALEAKWRQHASFVQNAMDRYEATEGQLSRLANNNLRKMDWVYWLGYVLEQIRAYARQQQYNIPGIDWNKVPPNMVDQLKNSIDASNRQKAQQRNKLSFELDGRWYDDPQHLIEYLHQVRQYILENGNLVLYENRPEYYHVYQAIQAATSQRITGGWDEGTLTGLEVVEVKYNVEQPENGVIDVAIVDALIANVESRPEWVQRLNEIGRPMEAFFEGMLYGETRQPPAKAPYDLSFDLAGKWYNDTNQLMEYLLQLRQDILVNGHLDLTLDRIEDYYTYQAIQAATSQRITGGWDEGTLNGIMNVPM